MSSIQVNLQTFAYREGIQGFKLTSLVAFGAEHHVTLKPELSFENYRIKLGHKGAHL